jgi:dTDP-3-amino-2,3,6-trideoxy-4-keto-D-glucose/dTDP-3-amino-3,4,6-trideoxy-alpha-D-glucose/dTDP-2,6-dideoxy-D-kanosamine transaminase
MRIPLNDTRRRFIASRTELLAAWERFLEQGVFVGGPSIETFEQKFASYCTAEHCVAVGNGTDALEFALRALGVRNGDEVITVANAGGYTTTACLTIGAVPVYVDVNPTTAQLDLKEIEPVLDAKTKAIVVTHLYGLMNDVSGIRSHLSSLGREDVMIVEDCAQAHGATFDGRRAGSLGDAAAFSFYPTKNLGAVGDAGAVVCSNSGVAEKVRRLRQYGWDLKYHAVLEGGRNSRMDPLHAIILAGQLPTLTASNVKRRKICDLYARSLPSGWTIVRTDDGRFVGHLAVLIAPDPSARQHARQMLEDRNVDSSIHYPILDCDQPAWQERGRKSSELAVSRFLTQRVFSIPCFAEMTADELEHVIDAIRTF